MLTTTMTIRLCFLGLIPLIGLANQLTIVNSDFSAVQIQCSLGYAVQPYSAGGTCTDSIPHQDFNAAVGIGWTFSASPIKDHASGLTRPNTRWNPPSFNGMPFSQAAAIQSNTSWISQTVDDFSPDLEYWLRFYLGSRTNGLGNQTVQVTIDDRIIATLPLSNSTPFTLRTVQFTVGTTGSHTLKFAGLATTDQTAFVSGVSIQGGRKLTVSPSSDVVGANITLLAGGFDPFETVTFYFGQGASAVMGTASAKVSGDATLVSRMPAVPFGRHVLKAIGDTSGVVATGGIAVLPRVLVSPNTGRPGDTVSTEGFGYGAGEVVSVYWYSPRILLASPTTDALGSFSAVSVTIPSGASLGLNAVGGKGQTTGAVGSGTITLQ